MTTFSTAVARMSAQAQLDQTLGEPPRLPSRAPSDAQPLINGHGLSAPVRPHLLVAQALEIENLFGAFDDRATRNKPWNARTFAVENVSYGELTFDYVTLSYHRNGSRELLVMPASGHWEEYSWKSDGSSETRRVDEGGETAGHSILRGESILRATFNQFFGGSS